MQRSRWRPVGSPSGSGPSEVGVRGPATSKVGRSRGHPSEGGRRLRRLRRLLPLAGGLLPLLLLLLILLLLLRVPLLLLPLLRGLRGLRGLRLLRLLRLLLPLLPLRGLRGLLLLRGRFILLIIVVGDLGRGWRWRTVRQATHLQLRLGLASIRNGVRAGVGRVGVRVGGYILGLHWIRPCGLGLY